jgi:protein tyrosine/serine phosphatase
MDALVALLREAPKPMLIHCKDGADRAALASALYHLAIEGKPLAEADDELTVWYGHIPFITPHVAAMGRSLQTYAQRQACRAHEAPLP